jgi:hypothetical protein
MRLRAHVVALVLLAVSVAASAPRSPVHAPRLEWVNAARGLDRAIVDVAGGGEGWRTRVVAVRIDPDIFSFRLRARLRGVDPAWSIDRAPAGAVLAVNAGQFNGITPWGWLVMDGREIRPPGRGPLSTAIAWNRAGHVRWLGPEEIEGLRATGEIVEAFQSYPTLLDWRGDIPRAIREPGLGVNVEHHDARLAVGTLADGSLVFAITRFYGLGPISPAVPLGLTLSEMAGVMRGLGCRRAVSLDGGVSAQLMMRANGRRQVWRGWRNVPLGLVAEPREDLP